MSSNRFDPLDPTVPLETVEQWIAAPPQPGDPVESTLEYAAAPTEYLPVPQDAPVTEYVPTATEYAPVPEYAPVLDSIPAQQYAVSEPAEQLPSSPANVVIEPVRSPGIVLPEPSKPPAPTEIAEPEIEEETVPWKKHLLPWLLLVLAVLTCLFALAQLVPGWWSNFIAGLVDGYSARGAAWGAGIGFLFTYLATLMIGHAVHKWANWKAPLALVIGGLVVAAPNLFTLWINHGPTTAARNADALLDRTAPLFRGASLAGAAAGLVLGILTTVLYRMWRKRTRRIKAMESLVDDYA